MMRTSACVLVLTLITGGCQTIPDGGRASIDMADPSTRVIVTAVLAKAVNRGRIELGPMEADASVITVLPPPLGPYETHSTVLPVRFDIRISNGTCQAVRSDTQAAYDLPGVSCHPVP